MDSEAPERPGAVVRLPVVVVDERGVRRRTDTVAAEEPLEIRVEYWDGAGWAEASVAVTMRTPGQDFALAAGFLFTEGVIAGREAIARIAYCLDDQAQRYNVVRVTVRPEVVFDPQRLSRHVYTTSSCGVCGKAALALVRVACPRRPVGTFRLAPAFFWELLTTFRAAQRLFGRTGGVHGTALFDAEGRLLGLAEDVGRHNAMDKLVGELVLAGRVPASETVVLVSGRASFELVQKALMAGIPALAAVGAPSHLAVALAREYGMTLVGFLREGRINLYAGEERVALPDQQRGPHPATAP